MSNEFKNWLGENKTRLDNKIKETKAHKPKTSEEILEYYEWHYYKETGKNLKELKHLRIKREEETKKRTEENEQRRQKALNKHKKAMSLLQQIPNKEHRNKVINYYLYNVLGLD